MSDNFTRQLDRVNRAQRADSNIPKDELQFIEKERNEQAKTVRDIATKVEQMSKEVDRLKHKIEILTTNNTNLTDKINQIENQDTYTRHKTLVNQPSRTSDPAANPQSTNLQQPEEGLRKTNDNFTEVKKKKKKKYYQ